MSESKKPSVGSVTWMDLTVPDAEPVREFYESVVGWKSSPVDMGGYNDHQMINPETGDVIAGVCHHKGPNEGIPPVWMLYVTIADMKESLKSTAASGGKVVRGVKEMEGYGKFAIVEDPAGATITLYEPFSSEDE